MLQLGEPPYPDPGEDDMLQQRMESLRNNGGYREGSKGAAAQTDTELRLRLDRLSGGGSVSSHLTSSLHSTGCVVSGRP